jgi:hypothetical protein
VAPQYSRLLASTGIKFEQAEITALDTTARTATIQPVSSPGQVRPTRSTNEACPEISARGLCPHTMSPPLPPPESAAL